MNKSRLCLCSAWIHLSTLPSFTQEYKTKFRNTSIIIKRKLNYDPAPIGVEVASMKNWHNQMYARVGKTNKIACKKPIQFTSRNFIPTKLLIIFAQNEKSISCTYVNYNSMNFIRW